MNAQVMLNLPQSLYQRIKALAHAMHAETPMLVIAEGDAVMWRVPVHLTFPDIGDVGSVGFLYVAPITGTIDTSPPALQTLRDNANQLAARFASIPTHTS